MLFAVVTAIMLVRTRARAARLEAWSRDEIARLRDELDRANALMLSEPQVVVDWPAGSDEPEHRWRSRAPSAYPRRIACSPSAAGSTPAKRSAMERAVDALRARGEAFSMTLTTLAGHPIEAQGRAIGGRAVLRLKDASGIKRELVELVGRYEKLSTEVASLRALIETLPSPVWTRDAAGRLTFVNAAYARAVEAKDAADAIERSLELLDSAARESIAQARTGGGAYAGRLRAVVAGARRTFDVLDFRTETGSAGIGIDATEVETMRSALARIADAHRRTLDQLSTGVAMFDADHRLTFYNAAYRALWDLDAAFLDQGPTDSAVIETLRAARKLPEQQDFRQWKAQLHEAYRAIEAKEHTWHLPDGRTLARRHHAQSGRRRHLSVPRRHRAARSRAALRGADPRSGRNARQSRRRRRGVRQRRPAAAAQCRLRPHVEARRRRRSPNGRISKRSRRYASRCTATRPPGRRCATSSPRSTAARRHRAGSNGATAAWSTARPCRCPTAPPW